MSRDTRTENLFYALYVIESISPLAIDFEYKV